MSDMFDRVRKVFAERGKTYGPVAYHWARTAEMWTALLGDRLVLGERITVDDVARFYVADKLVRDTSTPIEDNLLDVAGYVYGLDQIRGSR